MSGDSAGAASFNGLGVAAFESRRAEEMATLISKYGGVPYVGPSTRELPLEDNRECFRFAEELFAGRVAGVIFMTGVGAETLVETLRLRYSLEAIVQALSQVTTIVRGPKPAKVLRELGVPISLLVPNPNTWREILMALDDPSHPFKVQGNRLAVQEHGAPNETFMAELKKRGAEVLPVPVYRWALPEDLGPLRKTIRTAIEGQAQIVLFTSGVQVDHALRVAAEDGVEAELRKAFHRCVVGSIGPVCTEAIEGQGIHVDFAAAPPKMGVLILEAARRAQEILRKKHPNDSQTFERG